MNLFDYITEYPFLSFIVMAAVTIIVILISREIRCWYWKIEDRLELQEQELSTLEEIVILQKKQIRLLENIIPNINQPLLDTTTTDKITPTEEKGADVETPVTKS